MEAQCIDGLIERTTPEGDVVSLTCDPVNFTANINKARLNSTGAVSTFMGTTRDNFEGKLVTKLEYECYPDMALDYMATICHQIRAKWSVGKIVIQHKIGDCPLGEVSIVIAISSDHRKESLDAVQYAIDELKKSVPIWKKEFYDEGSSIWKANSTVATISNEDSNGHTKEAVI